MHSGVQISQHLELKGLPQAKIKLGRTTVLPCILGAANSVIAHNTERKPKEPGQATPKEKR